MLPAEVLLVSLLVLLLEAGHVVGHMDAEDVLPVHVSIQALALAVISGETSLGVRDVKSSIDSSLEGSEDLKTNYCSLAQVKRGKFPNMTFCISSGSLNHNFH